MIPGTGCGPRAVMGMCFLTAPSCFCCHRFGSSYQNSSTPVQLLAPSQSSGMSAAEGVAFVEEQLFALYQALDMLMQSVTAGSMMTSDDHGGDEPSIGGGFARTPDFRSL